MTTQMNLSLFDPLHSIVFPGPDKSDDEKTTARKRRIISTQHSSTIVVFFFSVVVMQTFERVRLFPKNQVRKY
jgi:hypothetical protein